MQIIAVPVHSPLDRVRQGLGSLPPFSPVLNRLLASLSGEDVFLAEVADLIEKDTVLTGNVLQLVNSALYARRGQVSSVRHAISLIGLARIRNFVIGLSLNRIWSSLSSPPNWSRAQFSQHSFASGMLADLLAAELPVEYPEGAFAAGLLQNIGVLLIAACLPPEFEQIRAIYLHRDSPLEKCESAVLGFDHSGLSTLAVEHWRLPRPIQDAIALHSCPPPCSDGAIPLALLLRFAEILAAQCGVPIQPWIRPLDQSPAEIAASLALPPAPDPLIESFEAEFAAVKQFFL